MLCTNAEGASLRGCNFEDPAGIKANLEGEASDLISLNKPSKGVVVVVVVVKLVLKCVWGVCGCRSQP